ncbi:39S ribosomal protein L41, mitochondrial [Acipenser ruthenus]|uniref:39S ribosomal protein L41, mitochondrial n=1 Tax=Acipenser ruthenus TaxID=7906 RepID=A0A444UYH3_ACIRT|nr:large ribosomal subunit protein mL41-like [Acipenser ruthenus]XP_034764987.1 large ribosomal subunit protein mL41-like [Acipenser ruthenus]XP_034764988.1 large ribosomal subunit protein mL41-like [Acipenser ruthenus]RXM93194.1 39S ribosomal protein L41, mitochondrial [Acipenser ruthenus]
MGLLSGLARGLVRGADRMAEWTSKRGSRTFYKNRGARKTGVLTSSGKFVRVREMVPELVVPRLDAGFKLKPYVSYRAPPGTEEPQTPHKLFTEVVAPRIEKEIKEGTFDPDNLEKYGLERSQEGKIFQLYPKNYVR